MRIALYDWPVSPYCMKVRAVLETKGLEYEKRPAMKHFTEVYRRGGVGKVPAIDIDGDFLVDSTDICHELERRFPEPSILPSDRRDRALCHALEDWTDEALYFFGLYYNWYEPTGRALARKYFARTLVGRLAFPPYLSRVKSQLRGHGISRKSPSHVRADLERTLGAIEDLVGDQFLLGDRPYLCDFALCSQLKYLALGATTKTVIDDRPALRAYVDRLPQVRTK